MTDHPNAPPAEDKTLPAPKELTDAEKQRARMDALMAAVEQRHDMLTALLKDTGITYEKFVEVFRRAIIRGQAQPATNLLRADAGSVIEACINACTDGLLPDGRQGAIVLYNTAVKQRNGPTKYVLKANWQPMVQGLLDIAYKSGNFRSIEARAVYDGDSFEYAHGDDGYIRHRPKPRPAGGVQPAIIAAYAVAKTTNGGVFREVFEGADIAKVNAVSKATSGPGKAWPEEMARKGPVRRMWKYLPKSPAMDRIVERDNDGYELDDAALEDLNAPVPERKLRAGFGSAPPRPAAIAQGADPVMQPVNGDDGEFAPLEDEDGSGVAEHDEQRRAGGVAMDAQDDGPAAVSGAGEAEARTQSAVASAEEGDPAGSSADGGKAEDRPGPPGEEQASTPTIETVIAPEALVFQASLANAKAWLAVKQALKTLAKTDYGQHERADRAAKTMAWERMQELGDKTDFVSDPILFECWLLGAADDAEAVQANWEIVRLDKAFERLADEDRARIAERVAEVVGDSD